MTIPRRAAIMTALSALAVGMLPKSEVLDSIPAEWSHAPNWDHQKTIHGYQITNIGKSGVPNIFRWRGKEIRIPLGHTVCGNEYSDGTCYVSMFISRHYHPGKEVISWGRSLNV